MCFNELICNFLWSIWVIQNPEDSFESFLFQYNKVIYEHPFLYNTIIYKFISLTFEKFNDTNLIIMTKCLVEKQSEIDYNQHSERQKQIDERIKIVNEAKQKQTK